MKKFITKVIVVFFTTFLSAAVIFFFSFLCLDNVYKDNYQRGFSYQYNALKKADPNTNKIIVIGGSYMTFATDSKMLSRNTGLPVYTLGIHSGMGMQYVFDSAKNFIKQGDILIFSYLPYKSNQFGMDLIFLSIDSDFDMFVDFFKLHPFETLRAVGAYTSRKLINLTKNTIKKYVKGDESGEISVYSSYAFDEHTGNLIYPRESYENGFLNNFKYSEKKLPAIDNNNIFDVSYLSEYCKKNGVDFYLIYSPYFSGEYKMNPDEISKYQNDFESKFKVNLLASIDKSAVPLSFIYNGSLHMNDKGKKYYTDLIYEGLLHYLNLKKSS